MVFVNGVMHGYFPPFDAPSVAIDVTPRNGSVEISLRMNHETPQEDFTISLELIKP